MHFDEQSALALTSVPNILCFLCVSYVYNTAVCNTAIVNSGAEIRQNSNAGIHALIPVNPV